MTIEEVHDCVIKHKNDKDCIFQFDLHNYESHIKEEGLGVPLVNLSGDCNLEFDSLDLCMYCLSLEEIFDVSIPEEESFKWATVRDAYNTVLDAINNIPVVQ